MLAAAFAGPPALPYAAEFRYLVQQHLTELVQASGGSGDVDRSRPVSAQRAPGCQHPAAAADLAATCLPLFPQDLPSLHIKTRDYTHIDGRCAVC